jgi:RND family efflux transporter MFP subunit
MLTVMDTSSVIAKPHIPQDQAAQLKPGNTATMKGPGDVEAEGKVTLVSPALDPNSTTVEIWVEAANADGRLRPGSSVTLEMVAQSVNDAIVVPASAILKSPEGATTVMVIENDKAEQKEVETGIREGNSVQITKGLTGNETVIVNGSYALPDKTRVKIAQATPAEEPAAEKPSGDKDKD